MNSINEQLDRLGVYKENIKSAIIEKGQQVGENMAEYADAISAISGGGEEQNFSNLPYLTNDKYECSVYTVKDNTCYFNIKINDVKKGLYMIKQNEPSKLLFKDEKTNWINFYEASDGTIYTFSEKWSFVYKALIIRNGEVKQIKAADELKVLFEASDGTLYAGNNSDNLWCIKDDVAKEILHKYNAGRHSSIFFQDKDGKIYYYFDSNLYYVEGESITEFYNNINIEKVTKDNLGNIFLLCNTGVYLLNNGELTQLTESGKSWFDPFISKQGIFINGKSGNSLWLLRNGEMIKVLDNGYGKMAYYEDDDESIIITTTDRNGAGGLYQVKNGNTVVLNSTLDKFDVIMKSKTGKFIFASSYDTWGWGVWEYNNGTVKELVNVRAWTPYLFEGSDNTIYASAQYLKDFASSDYRGLWAISDEYGAKKIINDNGDFKYFVEKNGVTAVASDKTPGVYTINKTSSILNSNSIDYKWIAVNGKFVTEDFKYEFDFIHNQVIDFQGDLPKTHNYYLVPVKNYSYFNQ